jgi:hypothetical protein
MFGRKSLPIGVMFLLLIVALASLGVVYGHWSKYLWVKGRVETGDVNAELSLGPITDNETVKDIASCTAALYDDPSSPDNIPEVLKVTMHDGYPQYECTVEFDVHSVGTIPIRVSRPYWIAEPNWTALQVSFDPCYPDGVQLHKSERDWCTLRIWVNQEADQHAVYEFKAEIYAVQYNKWGL